MGNQTDLIKRIFFKAIILFFVCLVFLWQCSPTKQHDNFKLKNKAIGLQRPTLLRTDGVYVQSIETSGEGKEYRFYRFFENGRCFASRFFKGLPDHDSLKVLSKEFGERTYFINQFDKAMIESWGGSYAGYTKDNIIIDSASLSLVSFRSRGIFTSTFIMPRPAVYYFMPLEFKNSSDW